MKISENTIQAVKSVSLADIVGRYTTLKKHGGEYRGVCPFHEERTASFYVHPGKGYKCFGCEAKGSNAVSFIMAIENKSYPEAVAIVCSIAGIPIEQGADTYRIPTSVVKRKAPEPLPVNPSFIPVDVFKASLQAYQNNRFIKYLISLFGAEITGALVSKYFIGSTHHKFSNKDYPDYISEGGATVFWQIDLAGKIRSGKLMLFNPATGKRVKEPFNHVNWVHSVLRLPDYELEQCFFGEQLLNADPTKPIAIVESEKTAIIASVYLPQFTWLACGSLTNLNKKKCKVLTGRNVTLFPDKGSYEVWAQKAEELNQITTFKVSDLLEVKNAEPKSDLADYLVKINHREFEPLPIETSTAIEPHDEILLIEGEVISLHETPTGPEFNHIIIAQMGFDTGKKYEVLYPSTDDALPLATRCKTVDNLSSLYNKTFVKALHQGTPCLAYSLS